MVSIAAFLRRQEGLDAARRKDCSGYRMRLTRKQLRPSALRQALGIWAAVVSRALRDKHVWRDVGLGLAVAIGVVVLTRVLLFPVTREAARPVDWNRERVAAVQARASAPPQQFAFGWPVPEKPVISPFGLRRLPWEAQPRLHEGVDIAAPQGSLVRLVADGVVVRAGADAGYGRFVEVEHPSGLKSFYAHLSAIAPYAAPGAPLQAGVPIGLVGNTGSSTGAHLHFEMTYNGKVLNPTYFMGRAFKTRQDLPLVDAAKIPPGVRIASVSRTLGRHELLATRSEASMPSRVRIIVVPRERRGEAAPGQAAPAAAAPAPAQPIPAAVRTDHE